MAKRFAAASGMVSGLVLAAALAVAAPAKAQGFFSFYEMSPGQIAGMLEDDGYQLRGPMHRRGDVYVADVASVSGRSARLIVSARDGRILERFGASQRWRDGGDDRWRNHGDDTETSRVARSPRYDDESDGRHGQMAMGDLFNPPSRVYGNDSMFSSKPTPPGSIPDADSLRPKHHTAKKHKDTNVARTPASPAPEATPAAEAPKPADGAVAAVAPNSAPEPKKPAVEAVKPAVEAAPKPTPTPESHKVEVERRATAEPAPASVKPPPKPEPARKKLNDLPVGTLD